MTDHRAADAIKHLNDAANNLEIFKAEVAYRRGNMAEIADMCTQIRTIRDRIKELEQERP